MKRVLSLMLSLLLCVCGCGPATEIARAYLRYDQGTQSLHGYTAFGDMVLSYPDPDGVTATLDRALTDIADADVPNGIIAVYEAQVQAYNQLVSATPWPTCGTVRTSRTASARRNTGS